MSMSLSEVIESIEREMFNETVQRELGEKYREILLLDTLLLEAGIPHEIHRLFDGYRIVYRHMGNEVCAAIECDCSYGYQDNLIEIRGLTQDGAAVEGGLSAQEVYDRILTHFNAS